LVDHREPTGRDLRPVPQRRERSCRWNPVLDALFDRRGAPREFDRDAAVGGCGQFADDGLREEVLDGHVDDLGLGIPEELQHALGDRLLACDRPDAALFDARVRRFELA
jgi:hypothetical protein